MQWRAVHLAADCFARRVAWLVVLAATGCGSGPQTTAVHGKASYRGEPLTNASINFFPTSGRPVSTALAEGGEYQIDLAPGEYQVTISLGSTLPPGWKEGDRLPPPKLVLPPQYTTQAKTVLNAVVGDDGAEPLDFDLK